MEEKHDIETWLTQGQAVRITPRGYSMYPFLIPGRDETVIGPLQKAPRRGDVVLYRRKQGILVLHRVWRCGKDGIYLVGDNQKTIEGPLDAGQIRGILTAVVRNGRFFTVRHPVYRFLSGLWLWLRPVRPVLSRMAACVKRNISRVKKIKNG